MLKPQRYFPHPSELRTVTSLSDLGRVCPARPGLLESPEGWVKSCLYQGQGVLLHACESFSSIDQTSCLKFEDQIIFYFHIDGRHTVIVDGEGQYHAQSPELIVMSGMNGLVRIDKVLAGDYQSHIGIALSPEYLKRNVFTLSSASSVLLSTGGDPLGISLPLTAGMLLAARSFISRCFVSSKFDSLYGESKTLELVCMALEALQSDRQRSTNVRQIAGKLKKLQKVRRIISDEFDQPLSLEQLATKVAMSKAVMTSGFKKAYGMSVFDCIVMERMLRAYEWLEAGYSVAQVAPDVGYSHACNFSSAFRRYFGVSPSKVRPH